MEVNTENSVPPGRARASRPTVPKHPRRPRGCMPRAAATGAAGLGPVDFTVEVTFVALGQRTKLSIHFTFRDADGLRVGGERYGVVDGRTQTLDRPADTLARRHPVLEES